MKKIILGLMVMSIFSFANEGGMEKRKGMMKGKNLEEIKIKVLKRIDTRIMKLENSKKCVKSATSKKDLRECKPKRNKKLKSFRN